MYFLITLFVLAIISYFLYKMYIKAINRAIYKERETIVRFLFDKSETYFDEYKNVNAGRVVEDMAWQVRQHKHSKY
jgi:hypothetical protein